MEFKPEAQLAPQQKAAMIASNPNPSPSPKPNPSPKPTPSPDPDPIQAAPVAGVHRRGFPYSPSGLQLNTASPAGSGGAGAAGRAAGDAQSGCMAV